MRSRLLLLRTAGVAAFLLVLALAIFPPFEVRGDTEPDSPSELIIIADGEHLAIDLDVATPAEALEAAGVTLADVDGLVLAGTFIEPEAGLPYRSGETPLIIEVRRAVPVQLVEDGRERTIFTSRPTVGEALAHLGIDLRPEDVLVPASSSPIEPDMRVSVRYARALVVRLPDRDVPVLTQAPTIQTALEAADVPLPEEYRIEPAPDAPVTPGLEVAVVALGESHAFEEIPVAAGSRRELDPSLPPGEERVIEGQDGVLHREWAVSYENGVEVARELVNEWYDPEPVDTVTYYGPDPTPTPVPRRSGGGTAGVEQWRTIVCSYDWDCEYALAVIRCESNGNADSYNPAGPYIGLFQIWHGYGGDLYDPAVNIAAAYAIYSRSGWSPWPNCP